MEAMVKKLATQEPFGHEELISMAHSLMPGGGAH